MELQIRHPKKNEIPQLKSLWSEIFDDDTEYIDCFFETINPLTASFCAFDGNTLAGMLFSIPAMLKIGDTIKKASYVYGVCTAVPYRKKGVMHLLHQAAERQAKYIGAKAFVLVPASQALFSLYKKIGYKKAFYRSKYRVSLKESFDTHLNELSREDFLKYRKKLILSKSNSFDVTEDLYSFRYDFVKSEFTILSVTNDSEKGFAVVKADRQIEIAETDLSEQSIEKLAFALRTCYGKKPVYVVGKSGRRQDYGMIKMLDKTRAPFDLYMNFMFE